MTALADLKKTYDALAAEIAAEDAAVAPLVAEGKALQAQLQPLLAKQRELGLKVKAARSAEYAAKRKALGALAVALGGKSIKAEGNA